ncbi:hypothetical protein G9F32_10450 [Acinetobacter sp. 194]|uniref:hypothetical protein n=1 Tax=Acinetobacter shaoyimingii TaxID=2715164 RepID=UPI001408D4EE|nr:hypothetical protein [Acinetobacter shaoyimingii]NHB58430.1 hypothetical protein [Acinetobacter shaoyimingii]
MTKLILALLSLVLLLSACSPNNKTNNVVENEVVSISDEEALPTPQEMREQLIKTFPELKPINFPPIDSESNAFWWFMTWQSDYGIATKYIARSDYKDWWSLIEKSINGLQVIQGQKILLEPTLNKMNEKIEKLEENEDTSLELGEVYQAYYENVLNEILKQDFDVIGLDNGEGAEFILAKKNNPELAQLAKMLQLTYPESEVNVYLSDHYPKKYNFQFLTDKLSD